MDITKTRLQTQGEHASQKFLKKPIAYRGMIKTAAGIGKRIYVYLKILPKHFTISHWTGSLT